MLVVVMVYMKERSLVLVVLEDRVWLDSCIELLVQEGIGLLARPWLSLQVSFHLTAHEAEFRVCCHSSCCLVDLCGNTSPPLPEFFNSYFSEDLLKFLGPQVSKCGLGNDVHIDSGRRASLRSTGDV